MTHTPLPFRSLAQMPLVDVLRLIRTLNVGPITFFHLIERFGTAAAALEALPELSLRGGRAQALKPSPKEEAEREIRATEKFGGRMIRYGEPDYPSLLHHIPDPPPVITVRGHAHLWQSNPCLAIVGSRNASANGCAFAQKLAKELGEEGITIISGLARGIDSFAHRGSLGSGTVAVIAGGIDHIYPPENDILTRQLYEAGAVVSEQPFSGVPYATSFPARNRIISGISLGVVVVEASPRSGSLITARFALEQGREVFAVPGSPVDPRARGCNGLLKDGANMVETAQDVLQVLATLRMRKLEETFSSPPPLMHAALREELSGDETRRRVETLLSASPVDIDTLTAQSGLPVGAIQAALLELELAGRAQRLSGGRACLLADGAAAARG